MKVFIQTDLEGATNVSLMEMTDWTHPTIEYAYRSLVADINAAVDGAFAGGATVVTVLDSHSRGNWFDPSWLDPRADYDPRVPRTFHGKLDASYDASMFLGTHAMAGTMNGFLDHTYSSSGIFDYRFNGVKIGELAMWGTVCGHFDIPVIMVSGDKAACAEAKDFFGDIHTVITKEGVGRNNCFLYDAFKVREQIRESARIAVSEIGSNPNYKLYKPKMPMVVEMTVTRTDYADPQNVFRPGNDLTRIDARTIRKTANTGLEFLF